MLNAAGPPDATDGLTIQSIVFNHSRAGFQRTFTWTPFILPIQLVEVSEAPQFLDMDDLAAYGIRDQTEDAVPTILTEMMLSRPLLVGMWSRG